MKDFLIVELFPMLCKSFWFLSLVNPLPICESRRWSHSPPLADAQMLRAWASTGQRQLGQRRHPKLVASQCPVVSRCPVASQCPGMWGHPCNFPAALTLGTGRGLAAASRGRPEPPLCRRVPVPEQHQDPEPGYPCAPHPGDPRRGAGRRQEDPGLPCGS